MGKYGGRDWMQIFSIYGTDEWQTVTFLLFHSACSAFFSLFLLLHFPSCLAVLHDVLPSTVPLPPLRYALAFVGSVAALSAFCVLYAAATLLHSSVVLRWELAQRMVAAVPDWSAVRNALDVGCGRGILLNAVATQMKKEGGGGRVVGLDDRRETAVAALLRAASEGVQEYVTCREGDARRLPFADGYFDVVVSAVHLSGLGSDGGRGWPSRSAAAAAERGKGLAEMVRVLKPGGVGVVWDLVCGPEYAQRLRDMRMEDVRLSERVAAYMATSHIVSFRKPLTCPAVDADDWRANIY